MNRYFPLLVALVLAGASNAAQAKEGLHLSIQGEMGTSQGVRQFDTDKGLALGALVGILPPVSSRSRSSTSTLGTT